MSSRRLRSATKRSEAPNVQTEGGVGGRTRAKAGLNAVAVGSIDGDGAAKVSILNSNSAPVKRKLTDNGNSKADGNPKKAKHQKKTGGRGSLSDADAEPRPGPSHMGSGNIGQGQGQPLFPAVEEGVTKTMLNELVLSDIAKKLPTSKLLLLRPTCFTWNRIFKPQHSAQHKPIHLYTEPNNRFRSKGRLISDFTKAMESDSIRIIPLESYIIHDLGLGLPQDLKHFFSAFGTTITRLDLQLSFANSSTIQIVRQIVFRSTPELRELSLIATKGGATSATTTTSESTNQLSSFQKELVKLQKFKIGVGQFVGDFQAFYQLMVEVFQCAVRLHRLSLADENPVDILQNIQALPGEHPALTRLKGFTTGRVKAHHLRSLIQLGSRRENPLRLLELDMAIICAPISRQGATDAEMVSLVHRFLVTQSNTLRTLRIRVTGIGLNGDTGDLSKYAARLPRMDNLTCLSLERDVKWQFSVQSEKGTFASNYPKLERLEMSFDPCRHVYAEDYPGIIRVPINQFVHAGLNSLKFDMQREDAEYFRGPLPLSALPSIWISVTKVELKLPAIMLNRLASFWTLWPALISLRVELTGKSTCRILKLDDLLSGVRESKFLALNKEFGSEPGFVLPRTMDNILALRAKYKRKPGISDLAQLQEFVLNVVDHKFRITDIGGFLGLALMPCQAVQHVALIQQKQDQPLKKKVNASIKNPAGNFISEECRRFMRSVFGLNAVIDL